MSLLRRTRNEVAGAWRSLRYDLGRRTEPDEAPPAGDVTSTGMSTFGGSVPTAPTGGYDEFGRPPRRLVAVSAFVVLAVVGAAGSYFAVVTGLGSLLTEKPDAAQARAVSAAGPRDDADVASNAGLGRGPAQAPAAAAPAVTTTTTTPVVPPATVIAQPPAPGTVPQTPRPAPPKPGNPPAGNDDDCCFSPPVPTPTAPDSPSPTPSDSTSPSPSPSESSAGPSADPSTSQSAAARRSHHR